MRYETIRQMAQANTEDAFSNFIKKFGDADASKLGEEIKSRRRIARSCFLLEKRNVQEEVRILELVQGHIGDRLVRDALNLKQFFEFKAGRRKQ